MLPPSSATCAVCGDPFEFKLRGKRRLYCSQKCNSAAHYHSKAKFVLGEPVGSSKACKNCGNEFQKVHKRQFYCPPCLCLSADDKLPASVEWNRDYQREYQKRRRHESAAATINSRMSAGIKNSLKDTKAGRSWESLVGYTIVDLMPHLERQFLPGMSWENRGDWHLDHVLALDHFNFDRPEHPDFKAAWAITNLRPLWAADNIRKSNTRTHLI
jgi:hypothetical protein